MAEKTTVQAVDVSNKTDLGITRLSMKQLDDLMLFKGGLVGELIRGNGRGLVRGEIGALQGGWNAKWINIGDTEDCGMLVLVAGSPRTKHIYRQGKISSYISLGLNSKQAEVLYYSPVKFKGELARDLAEILENADKLKAFKVHPKAAGLARTSWLARWKHKFKEELHLSVSREIELAKMVEEQIRQKTVVEMVG